MAEQSLAAHFTFLVVSIMIRPACESFSPGTNESGNPFSSDTMLLASVPPHFAANLWLAQSRRETSGPCRPGLRTRLRQGWEETSGGYFPAWKCAGAGASESVDKLSRRHQM